jgi:hypothetical protein
LGVYLDTSALAKLYHQETGSAVVEELLADSPRVFVSRLGVLETHSVLSGKVRMKFLAAADVDFRIPLCACARAASAAQLTTATSAIATVITNKAMMDVPLNGRNPFGLATLVPGVIPGGGSTPWISGGRNASSEITIDGTSIIVPENNVSIQDTGYQPIVDSIEEFAVITNSVGAEFGRTRACAKSEFGLRALRRDATR